MTRAVMVLFLIAAVLTVPGHTQRTKSSQRAGEQRNAEKGLKDNRYFFYFINPSITNFGNDEEKKIFKEAIQRDVMARLLYMKYLFHESFTEIRRSQELLIDLYRRIIDKDIKSAKDLLNGFAPEVVNTGDHKARQYLYLGYRDVEIARVDMGMADNFRENLYSMRLYKYVRAIKSAKHGKRYALFSMIYMRENNIKFEPGKLDFKKLAEKAAGITPDAGRREYILAVHNDNYYTYQGEKSFYDLIWENPKLEELPEYEQYMNIK